MTATSFDELIAHVGHQISVVTYGIDDPVNVAIECETCSCVLLDFDKEEPK